jgi:hypothetical protein
MTMHWEYRVLRFSKVIWGALDSAQLEQRLNELGREGWEVVSMAATGIFPKEVAVILKRAK